ncbi:MAG: hypothetical protein ACD_12C00254G0001, partial [uncultured bacterium]
MKKIILIIILVFSPLLVKADIEKSPNEILNEIQSSQNVTKIENIDCAEVTDSQFEELGDAYMEVIHPGENHELMDQMMGGEDSDSLKAMHTLMGKNYLNCDNRTSGTYGMMGSNMMGGMMGSAGSMMSMMSGWNNSIGKGGANTMMGNLGWGTGFSFLGWLFMILFWGLIILGIIALIRSLAKSGQIKEKTPLDILKDRYAKGEIDQNEYETKKKEL